MFLTLKHVVINIDPKFWEPELLVICFCTSATGASFQGVLGACLPINFLKIRISKMAILCIVRRIPCLSATVKWGIERVIFRLKHVVYILSTIRVVFQHVLRDIYLLFRNHGMKIKILLGSGWFYQKCRASTPMRVFTQSRRFSGFKCSNAGQTRRARVTWGLWINIYKYSVKTIFWNKHTRYNP